MSKSKFYVVWKGKVPGVYTSWEACSQQINGFKGAKYKSYKTREEAELQFEHGPDYDPLIVERQDVIENSLCVDAACSGNPGIVEYRGVYTATNEEVFRKKPIPKGTNNLGEFLAIVHGLALLQKENSTIPIYSDSETAMGWVRQKRIKTTLPRDESTTEIWELVDRALSWLEKFSYSNPLIKWDTKTWGEIPADFGRK